MKYDWTFRLSSPLDIVAAAEKPLPDYTLNQGARHQGARDWNGHASYSEAVTLAKTGWPDAPDLAGIAEQIAPTATRASFEMNHAVTGAFVDVSRFIEGHPENMLEFQDEPAPRHITLAINTGKHCEVKAREMELAGAVALAVIDTLNRSGFAASLIVATATESYKMHGKGAIATGKIALTTFPLSRAGEPVDPDQLAFWLCHPAAHRQLIFGFWDTCPRDFYFGTRQDHRRGIPRTPTAEDAGADYVLECSPETEGQARAYYHQILADLREII